MFREGLGTDLVGGGIQYEDVCHPGPEPVCPYPWRCGGGKEKEKEEDENEDEDEDERRSRGVRRIPIAEGRRTRERIAK